MKKYISIRNRKNSRGVAVIFTLGILGLLTVMALGFASTALLNRKIADNTSSADYARHIAKNIAFARAKWIVKNNLIADSVYSSGGSTEQDFLHKMDTVLDRVELYRGTNDSGAIQSNAARWQYVTDPNDNNRILGRYAFAIVPDSGHLDPVGNRGQTSVSGRYGFSEKEIGVYSMCNGDTGLNKNAGDDGVAGTKFRTFKEFIAAFKDLSDDNKKNFLKSGYRIQQAPSPDAFWIDTDQDGKKTKDELFLRFNMPRTQSEWETMTVAKLIGEGAGETDSDIKYTSTTKNSVDFIPWLKYWTHSNGTWTADLMKKQIAANIIQYNRPGPADDSPSKTISDKMGDSDDWLTAPPTYAGIGRHPMLNEIGFMIRVKAAIDSEEAEGSTPENPVYKYTPRYEITIDNGLELINPFSTEPSSKCHVKFSDDLKIVLKLRAFKQGSNIAKNTEVAKLFQDNPTSLWEIIFGRKWLKLTATASGVTQKLENVGILGSGSESDIDYISGWTAFNFSREIETGEWSGKSYTKADVFWKGTQTSSEQKKMVTFEPFELNGTDKSEEIKKLMYFYAANLTPGNTVLYCTNAETGYQRDFAKLSGKGEITRNYVINESTAQGERIDEEPVLALFSIEAKDPLVNHYDSDWTFKTAYEKYSSPSDINKQYPGTVFKKDDGSSGDDAYHLNSGISDSFPLKDTENGEEVVLESATDPAGTSSSRLSSSYIRHEPMKSLWELGFISRAEAFKTLNLARTRVFDVGTAYNARGGGTFAQGDANLLDQIKFSDTTDSRDAQGKININARYHKVFEWVFNKDASTSTGTTVNWYNNLITGTATDPYNTATPVEGTTKEVVCNNSSMCLSQQHSDSCTVDNCLAHLLMERSRILPFGNRADLLLDPDSTVSDFTKIPGFSNLSSTDQEKLKTLQRKVRNYLLNPGNEDTNEAKSKLVREQYAARFMNLLKADSEEHVYIIVLAQSIKDIGGAPAFVDWNGDGEYSSSAVTIPDSDNDKMKKFLRTGYIRKKLYSDTDYEKIGSVATVDETITSTAVGTYNYGADKITGETKLIVEMAKDANTGKWRIAGYRYVE